MKKIISLSFIHSLGVLLYVSLVALVMHKGETWFGPLNNLTGPILFLLLFVLSACIVGSLILLRPILWYMSGRKEESLKLLFYTIGWLAIYTIIFLITLSFE